jgi:putative DNA primase/helicase
LRALGGEVVARDQANVPAPGHSPKDRSLSIKLSSDAPDGFLAYTHSPRDDWRKCCDYIRRRLGLPEWQPDDEQRRTIPSAHVKKWDLAAVEVESNEGARVWNEDQLARIAAARRVFDGGVDPRDTLGERYITEHRKLAMPSELCGPVLRFHSACPWRDENTGRTVRVPALIAPFRSIDDDGITAVQRIRLNDDGSKYDRRMLGIVQRSAIKLDQRGAELHIGEGLETCMAGRQLGFGPTWALGSVGAISFFPIIQGVERLIIFGELGEASQRAIQICATRWRKAGRRVRIVMPERVSDLNDVLIERARAS